MVLVQNDMRTTIKVSVGFGVRFYVWLNVQISMGLIVVGANVMEPIAPFIYR